MTDQAEKQTVERQIKSEGTNTEQEQKKVGKGRETDRDDRIITDSWIPG